MGYPNRPLRSVHGNKFQMTAGFDEEQISYIEERAKRDRTTKADVIRRGLDLLMRLEPIGEDEREPVGSVAN